MFETFDLLGGGGNIRVLKFSDSSLLYLWNGFHL